MSEINLSLTVQEINTILAAMGEMPAKVSMNIIQKIQAQAASQVVEDEPTSVEE